MRLIAPKSIALALGLDHSTLFGKCYIWIFWKIARLRASNEILKKNFHKKNFEFVRGILHTFRIRFDFDENDLNKIPKEGPFIIIANHPMGLIDGLLMLHLIGQKRPDFKIFGNYLQHLIKQLQPLIFAVNPFKKRRGYQGGAQK